MKILLTNHHLMTYAGTEIFTYTLADFLKRRGHEVYVYSAYIGDIRGLFEDINVPLFNKIKDIPDIFDIAHVHHNIPAFEVRNHFPNLPMIFMSHGLFPTLEQPPFIDLGVTKYLAVSEEVQDNLLKYGIPESKVDIIRNPVNENRFFLNTVINPKPSKALVISNTIDDDSIKTIRQACQELNQCKFVGSRFGYVPNEQLPELIGQCDLVFSLSRGVIETMFCGRVPFVIDYQGGDGLVTPDNFNELIRNNFSGRSYSKKFTVKEMIKEIETYKPDYGNKLRDMALKEFSASNQTDKLLKIYVSCSQAKVPELDKRNVQIVLSFCQSINSTRKSTNDFARKSTRKLMISELGGETTYGIFRFLGRIRYSLVPTGSKRESIIRIISQVSRSLFQKR